MPYMMGQMGMGPGPGPGNNMRMPGPGRNTGMQQIPPSGPMMRHQVGNNSEIEAEKWNENLPCLSSCSNLVKVTTQHSENSVSPSRRPAQLQALIEIIIILDFHNCSSRKFLIFFLSLS